MNCLGDQPQCWKQLTLTPLIAMGATDNARQSAYRALFRVGLDTDAIDDIRLTLNQSQPLGNTRFHSQIERKLGERREARPRGRPRKVTDEGVPVLPGQEKLI